MADAAVSFAPARPRYALLAERLRTLIGFKKELV